MRGQVTGFAIVGVLMLIGVLALVWVSRAPNTQVEPERPSLDIEACIEDASLEAINAVGLAGGVHPDAALDEIAIERFGLEDDHRVRPALLAWTPGLGKPDFVISDQYVFDTTSDPYTRTATNVFPEFSQTRNAITTLIEDTVEDCEDSLTDGSIDVISTEFSDSSVRIESRVSQEGRSPRDVTVTVPVPIRSYHRLLRAAIEEDNRDPTFRFSEFTSDGFSLITLPTNNDDNDTLLVLRSDRPLIGSEPFVFLTLIEERPPVFVDAEPDGCSSNEPTFSSGDVLENVLVDPDDDHEPTATCDQDSPTEITYTLTSAGQNYVFEVFP